MLLRIEFPSGQLWSERVISLGLMTGVSWLIMQSREHIECRVVIGRKLIGRSIRWLAVMLSLCMKRLNEHHLTEQITLDECTKSTEVVVCS